MAASSSAASQAPSPADATLDRLFRHMAWANARLIARLGELPAAALAATEPGSEWTVAMTLRHLVGAAGAYAWRLEGDGSEWPEDGPAITGPGQLRAVADECARHDGRLRLQAARPEAVAEYRAGEEVRRRARSTILAQAIHHATEHRAQIAGALAANGWVGPAGVDLDELDVWSYGAVEGLGA